MDKTKQLFIILNTGGGDPDAAEKIVNVFRNEFKAGVEVIIPDYAKSAGTLISIGAVRRVPRRCEILYCTCGEAAR